MVTRMMIDTAIAALARHRPGVTDWHVAVGAALERALAAAWVPCAERMPEDCVEVLVAVWPSVYIAEREDGEWWAVDRMPSAIGGVTHWMPLPAPPKEPARGHPPGG